MEWSGVIEQVIKSEIRKVPRPEYSFTQSLLAFYHAVNCREDKWIFALFAAEIVILLAVIIGRKSTNTQTLLFFLLVGLLALTKPLNDLGVSHWRTFATQQYFDSHGIFMGALYAGPLLFIGLIHLLLMIRNMADMLIKVKRMELRQSRKLKAS